MCPMKCIALCACGQPSTVAARKRRCEILAAVVKPEKRVRVGDALASIGRKIGLTNEDFAVFEGVCDKTPAKPLGLD